MERVIFASSFELRGHEDFALSHSRAVSRKTSFRFDYLLATGGAHDSMFPPELAVESAFQWRHPRRVSYNETQNTIFAGNEARQFPMTRDSLVSPLARTIEDDSDQVEKEKERKGNRNERIGGQNNKVLLNGWGVDCSVNDATKEYRYGCERKREAGFSLKMRITGITK